MAVNETILIDAGVKAGLLSAGTLEALRVRAKRERVRLIDMIVRVERFPMAALYRALADVRGIPFLQSSDLRVDEAAAKLLPPRLLLQRLLLPVVRRDGARMLAVADPDDFISLERVERVVGEKYRLALADPDMLRTAIIRVCETLAPGAAAEAYESGDPVRLLDDIMKEAYLRRASDIHFEPGESGMRVRLRVDGQMQEYRRFAKADEETLTNRVKVLSGLDIAEQNLPQDGAMKYPIADWSISEIEMRVATIPTRWGERSTMRILGEETGQLSLEQLGMPEAILNEFRRDITRPWGMILVTGPTGSGKSTTLYAALRELRVDDMNVLTVEDPVEQTIEGISQVQVSSKVNFAGALRSFLRHDPDVILVGEIRDRETADIAMRAAMTGHLVMSTLHTNDAASVITRLADIGVERFLIGSTLIGALAQRLVRRLCPKCRRARSAEAWECQSLGCLNGDTVTLYEPVGCPFCLGTGYRGRTGLFEALWISRELRQSIAEGASETEIATLAGSNYRTLWHDCCRKTLAGEVSLTDVLYLRTEA